MTSTRRVATAIDGDITRNHALLADGDARDIFRLAHLLMLSALSVSRRYLRRNTLGLVLVIPRINASNAGRAIDNVVLRGSV